jgi:hypothetical protein
MTETEVRLPPSADPADDPRRVTLAHLAGRLAAGLATQTRAYQAAAEMAGGALRQALEGLTRAKQAQSAELAPLGQALGVPTPSVSGPAGPAGRPSWGVVLGEAFQGERTLEGTARELARLALDPTITPLAARLATCAARDGEQVRRLYLRYS